MPKGVYPRENRRKFLTQEHKTNIGIANKNKKRSLEARRNMSIARMGKHYSARTEFKKGQPSVFKGKKRPNKQGINHHYWKGGATSINQKIRTSMEYKIWRNRIFERDSFTCVWCGQKGGKLNADHIKPFAHYPELRLELSNGRTLCIKCHKTTNTYAGNGVKYKKI